MLYVNKIVVHMRSIDFELCSSDFLISDTFDPDDNDEIIRLAGQQANARFAQILHGHEVDEIIGHGQADALHHDVGGGGNFPSRFTSSSSKQRRTRGASKTARRWPFGGSAAPSRSASATNSAKRWPPRRRASPRTGPKN